MRIALEGRARKLGDNVNTDYIIGSTRKRDTLDGQILKRYLLKTVDPAFAASVQPGDLLVAGRNFGCGSAMEVAATVILAAGIKAVLAESFARTFYRNAINNGLIPVECATADLDEGDRVSVVLAGDAIHVSSASGAVFIARPLPPFMLEILQAGGLVEYLRASGGWRQPGPASDDGHP